VQLRRPRADVCQGTVAVGGDPFRPTMRGDAPDTRLTVRGPWCRLSRPSRGVAGRRSSFERPNGKSTMLDVPMVIGRCLAVGLLVGTPALAAAQNQGTSPQLFRGATAAQGRRSPLADAAQAGDKAAVQKLIQAKTDVNAAQIDGATALHWAIYRDDAELVDVLVRAGANVKAANREGMTPLAMAALYGNPSIIDFTSALGLLIAPPVQAAASMLPPGRDAEIQRRNHAGVRGPARACRTQPGSRAAAECAGGGIRHPVQVRIRRHPAADDAPMPAPKRLRAGAAQGPAAAERPREPRRTRGIVAAGYAPCPR